MSSVASTVCALCESESGLTWLLCDSCRTPENLASLLDSYADPASMRYSVDGHSALIAFGSADVLQYLPVLSDRIVTNPVLNGWWSYWYSWISSAPDNAEFFTYLQGVLPGCPALASLAQPKEQKQPPIAGQIATTLLSISNEVVSQFAGEAKKAAKVILKEGIRSSKSVAAEIIGDGGDNLQKGANRLMRGVEKNAKKTISSFFKHFGKVLAELISRLLHSVIIKVWLFIFLPLVGVIIGLMLLWRFLIK
jgi:hypothetical protein